MIKTVEASGKTEEDAVNAALAELGVGRDAVSVELLVFPKSGFLGLGAVPAKVRVTYEVPDTDQDKIRNFLTGLLEHMEVQAELDITEREGGGYNVELSGENVGAVIGRRGETLDAIQRLTNCVVSRGGDKHHHINVDAEGYRSRREESLVRLAEKMAAKAVKYRRSMALEPMNSYERHVIHTALQNYEGVTTSSTGVEPNRRVVVSYVRPEKADSKPKSREWA